MNNALNPYISPDVIDILGANPGAAEAKSSYVYFIDVRDFAYFPKLDDQTVTYKGNIVLKPGAYPIKMYLTADKQTFTFETAGDADARGITPHVTGSYPGYTREIGAYIHNKLGAGCVAIIEKPNGEKQIVGSLWAPLYSTATYQSDNTSNTVNFDFASTLPTNLPICYYDGNIPTATVEDVAADATTIDASAGRFFRLQNSAGDTPATIATITGGQDGDVISLIGSFGDKPANVKATDAILLHKGAQWNAVEGSVLSLRAMEVADGTLVWIETDRK